ncbi:3-oxo-Delta(4-5)-steroid 5-beta-reductase-like [Pyrus ussuriensis x Pyrus communis]|uniref:3-oxo-Delta(4-5)-steroid 5-beta-reductase-like n=1 Tax=Pyrus ussuriensis x Pyrus communis TaxID=2448454 RepID=A0A5N5H0H1_9ROSA|nr:3-oxo-Delta(4-5)-steroid 5-beta-reductase-like [Pyrus ussuriensis x Pyrus communis]
MAAEETKNPEVGIEHVVAIFGITGLIGKVLARELVTKPKWKVYGIARKPEIMPPIDQCSSNFHFIQCDLLNPSETKDRLSLLQDVTLVFWLTWPSQYQLDSIECCVQNKTMMSNALDSIVPKAKALKHKLGTTMKIAREWIKGAIFTMSQKTCLWKAGRYTGLQPVMICTHIPLTVSHTMQSMGQVLHGRKSGRLQKFGVKVIQESAFSEEFWYSKSLADKKEVWKEIVAEKGLVQTEMENLANWEFLDVLFRCQFKLLGTQNKVDRLWFTVRVFLSPPIFTHLAPSLTLTAKGAEIEPIILGVNVATA